MTRPTSVRLREARAASARRLAAAASAAAVASCLASSPGHAACMPGGPCISVSPPHISSPPTYSPPPTYSAPTYSAPTYSPPPVYVPPQPSPAELQQRQANLINDQGLAAAQRGDYAEAIRLYQQALALSTFANSALIIRHNIAASYSHLARQADDRGASAEALRMIELAMQYNPDERTLDWPGWARSLRERIRERQDAVQEAGQDLKEAGERIKAAQFAAANTRLDSAGDLLKSQAFTRSREQMNAARNVLAQAATPPAQGGGAAGGNTKFFGTKVGPGQEAAGPTVPPGTPTTYSSTGQQLNAAATSAEAAACVMEGRGNCPQGQPLPTPTLSSSQSPAFNQMAARVGAIPALANDHEFQTRFAYYRSLDSLMIETRAKIAAVQKQIDSNPGDREILTVQKQTLENTARIIDTDRGNARKSVDEQAKTLSISLDWPPEEAAPTASGPAAPPAPPGSPPAEQPPAKPGEGRP
jgi:tetratricopeptide (TPR) repeat protein